MLCSYKVLIDFSTISYYKYKWAFWPILQYATFISVGGPRSRRLVIYPTPTLVVDQGWTSQLVKPTMTGGSPFSTIFKDFSCVSSLYEALEVLSSQVTVQHGFPSPPPPVYPFSTCPSSSSDFLPSLLPFTFGSTSTSQWLHSFASEWQEDVVRQLFYVTRPWRQWEWHLKQWFGL